MGHWKPNYFDDSDDFDDRERRARHQDTQCDRCGSTDVRWRQQGGKWVLFSLKPGVVHTCELKADDFPDLA